MTSTSPDHETQLYVCEDVRLIRALHQDLIERFLEGGLSIRDFIAAQAERALEAHRSGDRACLPHFRCWSPTMVGWDHDRVLQAEVSLAESRETMAREYGFATFAAVDALGTASADLDFEHAVECALAGRTSELLQRLDRQERIVQARSSFGHRATLLHYLGANGVETFRQQVPLCAPQLVRHLVDRGADPYASANMYGGTGVAALIETSAHPAAAGVGAAMLEALGG